MPFQYLSWQFQTPHLTLGSNATLKRFPCNLHLFQMLLKRKRPTKKEEANNVPEIRGPERKEWMEVVLVLPGLD